MARITKIEMACAIVQAMRRQSSPASPNDPEVIKLAASSQVSQLAPDYRNACDMNGWREKNAWVRSTRKV